MKVFGRPFLPNGWGTAVATSWFVILSLLGPATCPAAHSYTNHLNDAQSGEVPDEFMVLNGHFAVQESGQEKWLELPGTPSDTYVLLFGPTLSPETEGLLTVHGQFYGQAQGRRYPAFGLGAYGLGGFRLQVSPAKRELELFHGETMVASQPYQWRGETWTAMRLEVVRRQDRWEVRGKAWPRDQPEPDSWPLTHRAEVRLFSGQASLWGIPYSGLPIRFDNLAVNHADH